MSVIIIENHAAVRAAIANIIGELGEIHMQEFESIQDALKAENTMHVSTVFISHKILVSEFTRIIRLIKTKYGDCRIVMLDSPGDRTLESVILAAGIARIIHQDTPVERLLEILSGFV